MKILRLAMICLMFFGAAQAQVRPGAWRIDRYLPLLEGKRVAVCGNQTSLVDTCHYETLSADSSVLRIDCSCETNKSAEMPHLVDVLLANKVQVVKIFCPEHGFRGNAEAGAHIASGVDERTGLPIISLYGNNKKPQPAQLQDVDVIVFDLQDVGCRFYTYISTLQPNMVWRSSSWTVPTRMATLWTDRCSNPSGVRLWACTPYLWSMA